MRRQTNTTNHSIPSYHWPKASNYTSILLVIKKASWPFFNLYNSLQKQYKTTKIVSISGSRESESVARSKSLNSRSESAVEMVVTELGWSQPIIKDWSLNDVWQLFKVIETPEELMDILDDEFYNELDEKTTFQGSLSKQTFVEGMSDVDVAVRFTNESFYLSETRDVLYYFFKNLDDHEIINVRKQPSSIGIFCKVDDHKFKIDFVPQRLQSNGVDYSIYRNSRDRNEKPTYKKTNPKVHEEIGRYKKSKLEMAKLFKVFKTIVKLPISGFITERFVFEIINDNIHQLANLNRFQRVKLIADEITNQIHDIELFDPANSNNMLTENLTEEDRNKVYDHFDKLSNDLENDSRTLRKYFPAF